MDSTAISTSTTTPPYHLHSRSELPSRAKSASRLAQCEHVPHLSLGLIKSSPKMTPSPSTHSLKSSESLPLRELLLLSPSPLGKRSKTRLTDRLEMADDPVVEVPGLRRKCKSRGSQMGLLGASPRNRRSRRRSENEVREEKVSGLVEEVAKPRKRRSKKEKLDLVLSLPSPSSSSIDDEYRGSLDRIGQLMTDLIMWRDVARSSLWFGLVSLFFLSSCFAKGINFSDFPNWTFVFGCFICLQFNMSKVLVVSLSATLFFVSGGFICIQYSFFYFGLIHRNNTEKKCDLLLKEGDILGVAKRILPAVNLALSKTRALFSGEPSMTLKVAPFFLLGAEYGHLITFWRLCMLVDCLKWWVLEAWGACSHKRIVAASAATAFWNLSSVKTRIFTAFISLVILRYCRQHMVQPMETEEAEVEQEQHHQALAVAGVVGEVDADRKQEQKQALVVAEVASNK
ncbi:hypothetical protein DVH24_035176 [Malus domestica]|uniref:Reticulon domain-containing protein n=1 Tax=Malus domestica TaxID=3750 RepID=A0A498J983_MALDO|nr:hypothetical protein DVH24_035176 [Malus domestica]